jgi:hypothetical protein
LKPDRKRQEPRATMVPRVRWFQLGVRAAFRSFLVDLFVPKIKLRERERVWSLAL